MKAYLDTVAGLVRCKVIGRYKDNHRLVVKITGKGKFLKTGSIMHYSRHRVVPLSKVKQKNYAMVIDPFNWDDIKLPMYDKPL